MNCKLLLTVTLLTLPLAAAQNAPKPLLSGTTAGLPWSLSAGGLTSASLQEESASLRLSAPPQASVLGTRYDPAAHTARLTYRYRGGLDARSALAFATNQLQLQGFDVTGRTYPDADHARAVLRREDRVVEVQIVRGETGNIQVSYLFRDAAPP